MKTYTVEIQTEFGKLVVEVGAEDDASEQDLWELACAEVEAGIWSSKISQVYG